MLNDGVEISVGVLGVHIADGCVHFTSTEHPFHYNTLTSKAKFHVHSVCGDARGTLSMCISHIGSGEQTRTHSTCRFMVVGDFARLSIWMPFAWLHL